MLKKFPVILLALMIGAVSIFAQDTQLRTLTGGQKYKIKGVVVAKDDSSFTIRDVGGVDTKVILTSATSIKTKGGFFGGSKTTPMNAIVRGLNMEVEGVGSVKAVWRQPEFVSIKMIWRLLNQLTAALRRLKIV